MSENQAVADLPLAKLGEAEAKRTAEARANILQEHSASFRWLMASFLAINGGGILLLKDITISNVWAFWAAVICFYVGIISALAIAWLGQKAARAGLDPIVKLETFWIMVAATGEFHQEHYESLTSEMKAAIAKSKWAPVAGWVSLAAFSLGLLSVAITTSAKSGTIAQSPVQADRTPAPNGKPKDVDAAPRKTAK